MNLLLVSIDSLRLDSVSRTNPSINTPRFDQLVQDFHFSDWLFSTSSATRPVHTSLFTGLYPFEHGIHGQTDSAVRTQAPHLFELFASRGFATCGLSEAHTIFANLPFASRIGPFDSGGIERATETFRKADDQPAFIFLHYWSTHTPYGAADGKAWGETAELLRRGQQHIVLERYRRAVEDIFERKLASVLGRFDLRRWCVLIFGDHGESWTPEEPYHGVTLRNSVLRVPFYIHLPGAAAMAWPRSIISMIDIFPFAVNLFDLEVDYRGFGRDIRWESPGQLRLAQITPTSGRDDLTGELDAWQARSPVSGPTWALFDEQQKFTQEVASGKSVFETTLDETSLPLAPSVVDDYHRQYAELQQSSSYADRPLTRIGKQEDELLRERLRSLGYL